MILHPSLGCPLIIENSASISLYIVANWNFAKLFAEGSDQGDEKGATGGNNIKLVIAQSLKVLPWKEANAALKNPAKTSRKLYPSREAAYAGITCTSLGEFGAELKSRDGQHFANVRHSTQTQFAEAGLKYLFQIDLANLQDIKPASLYDCFWASRNVEHLPADINYDYLDTQDRLTREFVFRSFYKYKNNGQGALQEAPQYAFKVGSKGILFQEDPGTPIMNRHPVYVPPAGKSTLNLGHLSDVHVSSKQYAYKGRQASVIPGADEKTSPPIGTLANNNGDNFFDLLQQFGLDDEVDLLVITGDLYDHIHNFDPRSRPIETTGNLWEAMYVDSIKAVQERSDEYPCGIDGLIVYSLLVHYYTAYGKPIFITSGNHEAYEYPYGISPRVLGRRANEGIPLDHNLTFYEAILLYGPGYASVLKNKNFNSDNFDWFSTVFSPLSDFAQSYKDQTLIGLQWGEGEDFLWNPTPIDKIGMGEGGTLPRATKSINRAQQHLVETALSRNGSQKIFCSHFTLVNYAMDIPLKETGRVGFGDKNYSRYEHGTTKSGREMLHGQWLAHSRFQLALSGHSHRVGLYACDYVPPYQPFMNQTGNSPYLQIGARMSTANEQAHLRTRGYHPEESTCKNVNWNNFPRVFVTASTGPIPKQNLDGEMSEQGMEYPSAGKILFNGSGPDIHLVKTRLPTAKPRFAVACDYIDIMEEGFWEHFKSTGSGGEFELKICWEKIHPNFPENRKKEFVESVTLWLVGDLVTKKEVAVPKQNGQNLKIGFSANLKKKFKSNKMSVNTAAFLSIKFNENSVQHLSGFKDYDYESPWNIQVGVYDKRGREVQDRPENHELILDSPVGRWINKKLHTPDKDPAKWQIMRHKRFGEVPNIDWRAEQWSNEFSYHLKKSRT